MQFWFKTHPERWLVAGLLLLAFLTLAFQGGDVDPAHCHKCPTRTPTRTPTPTLTPTPQLRACQIVAVIFDRETYQAGQPIEITVRLADHLGAPLIGANVNAEVTRQPLSAQAATGIGLIDRAGDYDGVYTQTENPGQYTFNITASDPTGQRFLACSAEATVLVETPPTATPTSTATPTPTATPTATPTTPANATVRVAPPNLQTTLCSLRETSNVTVVNVANLSSVQLQLSYNPRIIQVIDPDRPRPPVQVRSLLPADWIINDNRVDTISGRIFFRATGGSSINGASGLISIDWRPQAVGTSPVSLTNIILTNSAGQTISATAQSGAVQVNFVPNCRTGSTTLQGRTGHSGIMVANEVGEQIQTEADGYFALAAKNQLTFKFPGYLSAQTHLPPGVTINQPEAQATQLGAITLLAGDMNGDNVVNILDLVTVAQHYQSTNTLADLNADGLVDILDLVLVAGNYEQEGPLTAGP